VGPTNDDHPAVSTYHRLLVWDIEKAPKVTRYADRVLNPLVGKSLVVYLEKPAEPVRAEVPVTAAVPVESSPVESVPDPEGVEATGLRRIVEAGAGAQVGAGAEAGTGARPDQEAVA
jgi:hypothetical protein